VDPYLVGPPGQTLSATPSSVQAMLRLLSGLPYFGTHAADRLMMGDLVQVRRFFTEDDVRAKAVGSVRECIDDDTRVVIGHSLGSVVAYEALCEAGSDSPVRTFITLGSPLGIRGLVFDRLRPKPQADAGRDVIGRWPASVTTWTNVADKGDVVALVKNLSTRFGSRVTSVLVKHGAKAHDIGPYLSTKECGRALAAELAGDRS
jgi:pimeloyl-ACP methyl ester carboxylesterase